ncbi:tRNA (adenine-N1)-methyltransferase [Actinomyces sp. zg-332]|nr:tRNA (adenine-N1)-methyltransferase [Actinomyces sp. zg-332]
MNVPNTCQTLPLGQARRNGPFKYGERVQLTDYKGRMYTFQLIEKGHFTCSRGTIKHHQIEGREEGSVITSIEGKDFLALRPQLCDYVLSMPRGATIVYPKDAAMIIQMGDIFPGAKVLEAGVGSGGLSISLLSAIGENGKLISFERREEFAKIAEANVDLWFGARHKAWEVIVGDFASSVYEKVPAHSFDRVVLDMLDPWENLEAVHYALRPGGTFISYVATASQMSRLDEAMKESGLFTKIYPFETFVRPWHLDGLAVRPEHSMIGHTGFIITARTLAVENEDFTLSRRPANASINKGSQWDEVKDWDNGQIDKRTISDKKIRKVIRDLDHKTSKLDT